MESISIADIDDFAFCYLVRGLGQGRAIVVAKDEVTFVQGEADAILKFRKDEKGVYSELEINQGIRKMVAKRIESSWGLIGDATPKGWGEIRLRTSGLPKIKSERACGV